MGNAVLRVIKSWIEEHGYPPSVREIGKELGLKSTSTVHARMHELAGEGLITFVPGKSRTIVVTEKGLTAA